MSLNDRSNDDGMKKTRQPIFTLPDNHRNKLNDFAESDTSVDDSRQSYGFRNRFVASSSEHENNETVPSCCTGPISKNTVFQQFVRDLFYVMSALFFIAANVLLLVIYLDSIHNKFVRESVIGYFRNDSDIFSSIKYTRCLNEFNTHGMFVLVLSFILVSLAYWSKVKTSKKKSMGVVVLTIVIIVSVGLLVLYVTISNMINTKAMKNIRTEFGSRFVDNYRLDSKYFATLNNYMSSNECCGPFGMRDFKKSIGNNDILTHMPAFCQNATLHQYEENCYDVFMSVDLAFVDDALLIFFMGYTTISMALFLLYFFTFKSNKTFTRENLKQNDKNVRENFRRRFKRS